MYRISYVDFVFLLGKQVQGSLILVAPSPAGSTVVALTDPLTLFQWPILVVFLLYAKPNKV